MPTIATQTDFEILNMTGDVSVKRNKMTNLNNKDKRAWLRERFGNDWYKWNKKSRVENWKKMGHLAPLTLKQQFREQTRIGECPGCKCICEECERLML